MPATSTANMLVYRDGRRSVPVRELVRKLEQALASLQSDRTENTLLNTLLRAGELECALCDVGSSDTDLAAALTDKLAGLACGAESSSCDSPQIRHQLLSSIHYDGELTVSQPEGFAYYALHPLDFADAISAAGLKTRFAHVVGVRSIGTTLSAVVAAKLNADGIPASRMTVRPEGHPYDRHTSFTYVQSIAVQQAYLRDALFLVCDEGPGRSGSSLLSAAEALEREGISRDRIVLLCSYQPNTDALCAPHAPERWRRYHSVAAGMTNRLPQETGQYLGADEWRRLFLAETDVWPATWPHMERLKFLSRSRQKIFKFEGHGSYGEPVREREQMLASSGFGARYLGHEAGFGIHELVGGRLPDPAKPSRALLRHLANYCAWRARAFSATVSQESILQLEHMAAHNIKQELGFAPELRLEVERPAISDGRMQPHEWRELGGDQWVKLDASTHGDDHFFPGPVDIAWDLAGLCVEWQLAADHRDFLLSEYRRMSHDNPGPRLEAYEIAYAAFRLGWSRMAAASACGTNDEARLLQDAACYRKVLDRTLVTSALSR